MITEFAGQLLVGALLILGAVLIIRWAVSLITPDLIIIGIVLAVGYGAYVIHRFYQSRW